MPRPPPVSSVKTPLDEVPQMGHEIPRLGSLLRFDRGSPPPSPSNGRAAGHGLPSRFPQIIRKVARPAAR